MPRLALYYSPGACSLAAHIALQEWGVPFEARRVMVAERENLKPDYLALNPRGRVPLLLIDDEPVSELSGLLTWIGQQSGLYPAAGTIEAAKCAEWLGWLTSTVHIAFALIWRGERFAADVELHGDLRQHGYDLIGRHFDEIETALQAHKYAAGDRYSVADCNLLPFYRWGHRVGLDMRHYPAWTRHAIALTKRPAVAAVLEAESVSLDDKLPLPEGVRAPIPRA